MSSALGLQYSVLPLSDLICSPSLSTTVGNRARVKLSLCQFPNNLHTRRTIVSSCVRNLPLRSSAATTTFARRKASFQSEEEEVVDEDDAVEALKPSIVDEVSEEDEENDLFFDDEDTEDAELMDVDFDDDEYLDVEEAETAAGDGEAGGGILFAGTWWDNEALSLAEQACESFNGELKIYALRTLTNSSIRVRIETTLNKSGSPSMSDIEAFTKAYRELLDRAEVAKTVPDNLYLEVSSPGVERVVRIPQDLERFKDRPMYVRYHSEEVSGENDGVLRLISYDVETQCCTWGYANVKINREKAGKGRPMNKKQREWRVTTPFESLRLVRLYSEP